MDHSGNDPNQNSSHGSRYDINSKIMIAAVIVLFTVVLFVFLLHLYARWFWRYSARISHRRRQSSRLRRRFYFAQEEDLHTVGLDKAVLEALPMFVYTAENFESGLECAVCLSEFAEKEKGRILPKCKHSFHIDCIDMWFYSHSTCPLCRASAQPEEDESAKIEEVRCGQLNLEEGQTSEGRISRALPQIVIEVPKRRNDSFSSVREDLSYSSPNGSAKSPPVCSHLRSLSRMLSRDREKKVFPDVESGEGGGAAAVAAVAAVQG
ncbi:hypothetical protein SUGI_0786630 [Cryptomeria japonica]|uniref:RING-H2 finger protein ATL64 n=1 Tax=Cryptomeria japonica TaxID=3369 RepID=UPI002414C5F9|nr:RING-H2 finger protein ATL64 [Cryptomeria japonica]GLJ38581.1 hypothetical protein SUGI_0786630 [Cryptomeria japonica]